MVASIACSSATLKVTKAKVTRVSIDARLYCACLSTTMDKDSRDDFTFAKLSDLKLPITFRM